MSDQRKLIQFNKSMTANKRNENFAYLRKQVADVSADGLYPAKDYTEFTLPFTPADGVISGVFGSSVAISNLYPYLFILHDRTTSSPTAYSYDWYISDTEAPVDSFGDKRINGVVEANGTVYYTAGGNEIRTPLDSTALATYSGANARTPMAFDGLYVWLVEEGNDIWRWLPGGSTVEKIFDENPFVEIVSVCFYENQMVIFDSTYGRGDATDFVYFWDKSNSTFFNERIPINGYILAGGVIENDLYIAYSIVSNSNAKEEIGDIVIAQWNGSKFVEINRIKSGTKDVRRNYSSYYYLTGRNCVSNNNYMLFSIIFNANSKDELYKNYIFKIKSGGYVEVETDTITGNAPLMINSFRHFNAYVENNKIYLNNEINETNTDYTNYTKTTYITNFLCNPYNTHRLDGLSFTFEKLFNVEELDIYYRTSDRESFVLLGNITRQKVKDNVNKRIDQSTAVPTPSQRYQITKMPDNTALPEFNEIQFKFVSKKGFSIIGAWFDYSYITRNTLK